MRASAAGTDAVTLAGPSGSVSYSGLTATDAGGHRLPASLSVARGQLRIAVSDQRAVYPIRVDPFIQVTKLGEPTSTTSVGLGAQSVAVGGTVAVASVLTPNTSDPQSNAVDVFVANSGGGPRVPRSPPR